MLLITLALSVEAAPILSHLHCKLVEDKAFRIYENEQVRIVISGVGKISMAAATAYLAGLTKDISGFLNIGIAGHKDQKISEGILVHKIIDSTLQKSFYPTICFKWDFPTDVLYTLDAAEDQYKKPYLYDMEASAFFSTALRFETSEKIQVFKIVSDNEQNPFKELTKEKVKTLIEENLEKIDELINIMLSFSRSKPLFDTNPLFQALHFTAFQKNRLLELLAQMTVIDPSFQLSHLSHFKRAKHVLEYLENKIQNYTPHYPLK